MKKKYLKIILMVLIVSISLIFTSGCSNNDISEESAIKTEDSISTEEQNHSLKEATSDGKDIDAAPVTESREKDDIVPETAPEAKTEKKDVNSESSAQGPPPVEPQEAIIEERVLHCVISIECSTILNNMEALDPDKVELVPEDGVIMPAQEISFNEGESVFDVLQRATRENKIHMEFEDTPVYNSAYIEGIHNLYEFDCGELSGWMYKVNGWFPNYGCSRYQLSDGYVIEWVYTCDLGRDVGSEVSE